MAYEKPGVTINQVNRNQTPVLPTPDLEAAVVGNAYWWQDPTWDNPSDTLRHSVASANFTGGGSPATYTLSGINATYHDVTGDEELVIVDLLGVSGSDTGKLLHLVYGTDYSVAANQVTISGIAGSSTYQVRIGFRAKKTDAFIYNEIASSSDIENLLGDPVSWNPLAFGASLCQQNSNAAIWALGYEGTGTSDAIDAINDTLTLKEVYAIAPLTHKIDASGLKTHVETLSAPTGKLERIAFVNNVITHTGGKDPDTQTTGEKTTVAEGIRDANSAVQSKRVFSIHPDIAYILETRHITTVKPSWLQASFADTTTIDFSVYGPYCQFVSDSRINGVLYKAGTEITEALWTTLEAAGWGGSTGMVTVYAPVPGYYFNAVVAGQVIGKSPEQPLTNVPISGIAKVYASQDLFSEAQLNTMAEGGTYIMVQDSRTSPVICRHQMSTDITSVSKRELSITNTIDYAAKFIRKGLKPYIGRYVISPEFLKLVNTVLFGIGQFLMRVGMINDLKILSITQDTINPDTILAEVEILVKYPANYIKVTLVF